MIGVELEFIPDIDLCLCVEKDMKRGITYIDKRYSKANNKS